MKNKILAVTILLLSLNTVCFAYNETPLYATMQPLNRLVPESQPLDLGKRAREISEEGYRNFQLNAINNASSRSQSIPQHPQQIYQPEPAYNPYRNQVQEKPLYIFGR